MKYKALVVDDERLARMELIKLLEDYPEIEIAGEADSVVSAVNMIKTLEPELIFLDIQMPGGSGFDLLPQIDPAIRIVFVTAFDEYAIRAFEINALDYLLKPVYPDRLKKTIERVLSETEPVDRNIGLPFDINDRIFLSSKSKIEFKKISEIIAIRSAGDYTEILDIDSVKSIILKSMKEWEDRLPSDQFIRIHRSSIINLNSVSYTHLRAHET